MKEIRVTKDEEMSAYVLLGRAASALNKTGRVCATVEMQENLVYSRWSTPGASLTPRYCRVVRHNELEFATEVVREICKEAGIAVTITNGAEDDKYAINEFVVLMDVDGANAKLSTAEEPSATLRPYTVSVRVAATSRQAAWELMGQIIRTESTMHSVNSDFYPGKIYVDWESLRAEEWAEPSTTEFKPEAVAFADDAKREAEAEVSNEEAERKEAERVPESDKEGGAE